MDNSTMLRPSRTIIAETRADIVRLRDATEDLHRLSAASRDTVLIAQDCVRLLREMERLLSGKV